MSIDRISPLVHENRHSIGPINHPPNRILTRWDFKGSSNVTQSSDRSLYNGIFKFTHLRICPLRRDRIAK